MNHLPRKRIRPSDRDTPPDILYPLLQAAHSVEKRLEDTLAMVELSGPKYAALTVLVAAGEPISLGELANRLTCVRSNITQLIDRLESDGLVRRIEDPADRRGKRAQITALGVQRQAGGARQVARLQDELARAIAELDRAALAAALTAVSG